MNTENLKPNKIIETNLIDLKRDEETGKKILNDFLFQNLLGHGVYSKVKKCTNITTKETFAVKILNKFLLKKKKKSFGKEADGSLLIHYMIEDAENEIQTYKSLPYLHPNILSLFQIINDEEREKTYLIMEYAEKGPLVTVDEDSGIFTLNKFYDNNKVDEKLIKLWIKDIAQGIKFLHENNIIHGDIKPDNIVISADGHCKLGDFGQSLILNKDKAKDLPAKAEGNIFFFPPEFIGEENEEDEGVEGQAKSKSDYKKVDIWTFGVSLYTCIFKRLPFCPESKENVIELFRLINEEKIDWNKNGITISDELRELLSHMLEKDPNKRFSADDILNYPWLNKE